LWLTPLDKQLQHKIIAVLTDRLPNTLVSTEQIRQPSVVIRAIIDGFHGRYDGHVIVAGRWIIEQDGKVTTKSFEHVVTQKEDGYEALVRALSEVWQEEIKQLADVIRSCFFKRNKVR